MEEKGEDKTTAKNNDKIQELREERIGKSGESWVIENQVCMCVCERESKQVLSAVGPISLISSKLGRSFLAESQHQSRGAATVVFSVTLSPPVCPFGSSQQWPARREAHSLMGCCEEGSSGRTGLQSKVNARGRPLSLSTAVMRDEEAATTAKET